MVLTRRMMNIRKRKSGQTGILMDKRLSKLSERTRAKTVDGRSTNLMDYAHCRLSPFNSTTSSKIPDSSDCATITTDYLQFSDIGYLQNSTFTILLLPTLPTLAWIKASPDNAVNITQSDGVLRQIAQGVFNPNFNQGWIPLMTMTEMVTMCSPSPVSVDGRSLAINNPYLAYEARIVSMCHQLEYTGTAFNGAGTVVVNPIPYNINRELIDSSLVLVDSMDEVGFRVANVTYVAPIEIAPSANIMSRSSVSHRVEVGDIILQPHKGDKYKFCPAYTNPFYLQNAGLNTIANTPLWSGALSLAPGVTQTNFGSVFFFDNDWGAVQINFSGASAAGSFRLRTYLCMEWCPSMISPYLRLASKSSHVNEALVTRVSEIAKAEPITKPLATANDTSSWYDVYKSVVPFIKEVGPAVYETASALLTAYG